MYLNFTCVDPEGSACMAEEEFGIQLEEWEGIEEKQDAPPVSAIEDSLLFESKYVFSCLFSGIVNSQTKIFPHL